MDQIEEIKQKIDIVDLISGYLELKKSGVNYRALCPFHSEKTPSFFVSPEKQIWHCFGCQKGGDHYTFLMEMEGLEFYDALKLLADRAGVTLRRLDPQITKQKNILSEINEVAANFYHGVLKSKYGARSRAYLEGRGIQSKTIDEFKIGYAPKHFHQLEAALIARKGFKAEDVERAGLIIKKDTGRPVSPGASQDGYFDRFRERIMFPIRNIAGSIVGFSGRTLSSDPEAAKYLNSPDTPIFSKSKIIFGLDKAREAIKKADQVIVVEGQMDVVSPHQAGSKNVVGSSGTALTPDQIKILSRFTENIVLAFDMDSAGQEAAKRAVRVANQAGILPKMVIFPSGEDPDSLVQKNPQKWQELITKPILAMDYFFKITFGKYSKDLSIENKRQISKELLPLIKEIADPVTQAEYIKKLASKLQTPEKFVFEALVRAKKPTKKLRQEPSEITKSEPEKQTLEERVLGLILFSGENLKLLKKLNSADFTGKINHAIYKKLISSYNKNKTLPAGRQEFDLEQFQKTLEPKLIKKIDLLLISIGSEFDREDKEEIIKEAQLCLKRLRDFRLQEIKKDFEQKIQEAEETKNREKVKKLIREFQQKVIQKLPEGD